MFSNKGCQYSVPPEYIGKQVALQVYDGYIHVYYSTKFITIHTLNRNKLNYHNEHYEAIARKSHVFKEEAIKEIAIKEIAMENLKTIGDVYYYE